MSYAKLMEAYAHYQDLEEIDCSEDHARLERASAKSESETQRWHTLHDPKTWEDDGWELLDILTRKLVRNSRR